MPKLRVGIGDVLDARPLAWGFLKGHHADLFATETQPLPLVGRLLEQGELDAGLLPVTDAARQPDLQVLPELCVAFPGEARTLVLVSPTPVAEVRRVYLGRSARTSAVALRAVLAEGGGGALEMLAEDPSSRGASEGLRLRAGEAALLIGGEALRWVESPRPGLHTLDLGAAWRSATGLPLVAGAWAVRAGVALPDLLFYFKSSLRYGLSCLDAIAREAAAELGLPSAVLGRYFEQRVSYLLQDEERRGIDELLRRGVATGDLPEGAALRYWSP